MFNFLYTKKVGIRILEPMQLTIEKYSEINMENENKNDHVIVREKGWDGRAELLVGAESTVIQ